MDQLHARTTEFVNMLILVMSQLDAVYKLNVLNPMKINDVPYSNVCCDFNVWQLAIS